MVGLHGTQKWHRDINPNPEILPPLDCNPGDSYFSCFLPTSTYSLSIQPGSHLGAMPPGTPFDHAQCAVGDVLVMHSTAVHHGLPSSTSSSSQALPTTTSSTSLRRLSAHVKLERLEHFCAC